MLYELLLHCSILYANVMMLLALVRKKYLWHGDLLLEVALWTNECSAGSTVDV